MYLKFSVTQRHGIGTRREKGLLLRPNSESSKQIGGLDYEYYDSKIIIIGDFILIEFF